MKKLLILTGLCAGLAITPAFAQPPDEEGSTMDVEAGEIGQQWDALREKTEIQEIRDPKVAIAKYQDFYHRIGFHSPSVSIPIFSLIGQLYRVELGDREKAIQTLEFAKSKYGWHRAAGRLDTELNALKNNQPKVPMAVKITGPR